MKEIKIKNSVKNKILECTICDDKNGGVAKPEYKFNVFHETLKFENKSQEAIKLIIDDISCLFTNENCFVTMFAIGKLNGEVFSVNDTNDSFIEINQHLINGKKIVLYSGNINNDKIVYRYSLIDEELINKREVDLKEILDSEKKIIDSILKLNNDEDKEKLLKIFKIAKSKDNVLFFEKRELESLKKITKTTKISNYEILTDTGFVDIEALHETIPYEVYHLKLSDGKELKCADNHIVFIQEYDESTLEPIFLKEVFIKDLPKHSFIMVSDDEGNLIDSEVLEITNLGYEEVMYDLELKEGSNRRYYTNGILSHNTLLAKLLAEQVYGDAEALIRMDMSEYMEKHSVSRLVGPPPGYVGYDQGGQLTEKVRRKPHCVILFDEIEKAHEDVFNLLLQLLDEGQLTDGLGRKVNFKNALIILTSNIGVKEANSFGKTMGFETDMNMASEENKIREIIEKALKKKFRPEFLNRIDEAIVFNSLTREDIHKIIYVEIEKLRGRIKEMHYGLNVTEAAIDFLAEQGYSEEYGARPLNRAIQHYIEDAVADEILNENIKEGEIINIDYIKGEIIAKGQKKSKSK